LTKILLIDNLSGERRSWGAQRAREPRSQGAGDTGNREARKPGSRGSEGACDRHVVEGAESRAVVKLEPAVSSRVELTDADRPTRAESRNETAAVREHVDQTGACGDEPLLAVSAPRP